MNVNYFLIVTRRIELHSFVKDGKHSFIYALKISLKTLTKSISLTALSFNKQLQ